jgi:Ca-activated chloride channel family protein
MNQPQTPERPPRNYISIFVIILVVIALLAILAGLMLPSLAKAKAKGQRISRLVDLSVLDEVSAARPPFNTEAYDHIADNPFLAVMENPLSTFSIDVDKASYANIRRFLSQGQLPPPDAVRIEEMLNYFSYAYPEPVDVHPFSVTLGAHGCPWNSTHRLVRIGLKAKTVQSRERPKCNLVFLIDVSGSMNDPRKLPLVQEALELLVDKLADYDRVALVVYAGASGLVLDSTACKDRRTILRALRRLQAGGSTNGGEGLELAYRTAVAHFIPGGVNRVILCTDGDFNVGITSTGDLTRLIKEKARTGVFLTVLGFGMGNYKDATLEKLADLGNGNYGYIDTLAEARKLLVDELNGTLVTVAKDVKLQVEFNPAHAAAYRLLGYENRLLRKEEFNDDAKDAGDIGAGHTVTALYEVVPRGCTVPAGAVAPLKYQAAAAQPQTPSGELFTIKLRYKAPDGTNSHLMTIPFTDTGAGLEAASSDFKFAAAVAAFGMILRHSEHKGAASLTLVRTLAAHGNDSASRAEFLKLVDSADQLLPQMTRRADGELTR